MPFCFRPISVLDVVDSRTKTKLRYEDFKNAVYLLGDTNIRIQNVYFVRICRQPVPRKLLNFEKKKWRIYIRIQGDSRRYQAPSGAVVGKLALLCQLSSFPSPIAIYVDAIGPRILASAILFRPHRVIGRCSFRCRNRTASYSNFENPQYTSLVILISGYKTPVLSPIDVNFFYVKW
jgi:hypothetical protein